MIDLSSDYVQGCLLFERQVGLYNASVCGIGATDAPEALEVAIGITSHDASKGFVSCASGTRAIVRTAAAAATAVLIFDPIEVIAIV
jgi:hypothetical protein